MKKIMNCVMAAALALPMHAQKLEKMTWSLIPQHYNLTLFISS